MHKLSALKNNSDWYEHSSAPVYEYAPGASRIVAALPSGSSEYFQKIVSSLAPPYMLLYVLHTPRGEATSGRYQSPELTSEDFQEFITKFGSYLSSDSRFDIWARSSNDGATIVWDRHNLLYAYGPLEKLHNELTSLGFTSGSASIPSPHTHNYHQALDHSAKELLSHLQWSRTDLHPEDEQ